MDLVIKWKLHHFFQHLEVLWIKQISDWLYQNVDLIRESSSRKNVFFFYICANNSEFCAKSPSQMVCKIRVAYIANKSLLFWRKQFLGEFGGHIIFLFFILIKSSQLVQTYYVSMYNFYHPDLMIFLSSSILVEIKNAVFCNGAAVARK